MLPFTGQGDGIGVVGVGIAKHHKATALREESYRAYGLRMKELEERKKKAAALPAPPLPSSAAGAARVSHGQVQSRNVAREPIQRVPRAQSSNAQSRVASKSSLASPRLAKKKSKRPITTKDTRSENTPIRGRIVEDCISPSSPFLSPYSAASAGGGGGVDNIT